MSSPAAEPASEPAGPTRATGRPSGKPSGEFGGLFWGWAVFTMVCVASMLAIPSLGAVAFHLVWISMTIVYGLENWSPRRILIILTSVIILTAVGMASFIVAESAEWTELSEVPLMGAVFVAMVWHVRRRAQALALSEEAAAREQRANELKELFVRNCSHEMRTPITVARGYAEMARTSVPGAPGRAELGVVIEELDKLGNLAGRLLMLAEVYDGPRFERDCVDLAELVRRSATRWSPSALRRWSSQPSDVLVEGDESRLEAALDCLVENAIKFTNDGDHITIRSGADAEGAFLEVEDGGIGFELSATGNAPRTSGQPGTGLGLAIARAITEGHGGTMVVPSTGTGTRVRLRLPRIELDPAGAEPA